MKEYWFVVGENRGFVYKEEGKVKEKIELTTNDVGLDSFRLSEEVFELFRIGQKRISEIFESLVKEGRKVEKL